ncbi:MAG: class I SAM-dependent methyltransferase [Butyrivibrio sp.]|nr:class I SAM-dependent methyltransferase [Butyrivibrio sp.]
MQPEKTDWSIYYTRPKSRFSTFTQKHTLKYLLNEISMAGLEINSSILELGGGNSCFAEGLRKNLPIGRYDVIDNCKVALDKLKNGSPVDRAWDFDLCKDIKSTELQEQFDFVYSVGLVEHFSDEERRTVIQNHFACCKKGGFVLITAPTPTVKYRVIRKGMEIMRVWQFWDEVPIRLDKLVNEMEYYGRIIDSGINNLPLTQAVVLCRKE